MTSLFFFLLVLSVTCAFELNEFTFELFHTLYAFMTFYYNFHMMTDSRGPRSHALLLPSELQ